MTLTINANTARELAEKINELAALLGVDRNQLPLPISPNIAEGRAMPTGATVTLVESPKEDIKEEPKEEKPKRTRRTKEEIEAEKAAQSVKEEPKTVSTETQTSAPTEATASTPAALTKQDIANACQSVTTAIDLDSARSIVASFKDANGEDCRRISDIKESDYKAFIEACNAKIAGKKA
jgi:outer membrane biosynthesis protein TonB